MIGDFILWVRDLRKTFIPRFKKGWKQMFCIHDYNRGQYNIINKCTKCGRIK